MRLVSVLALSTCSRAVGLDAFIASESRAAYSGLLANIGPSGSKSVGALKGVVVAAPSDAPDYK